MKFSMKDPLSGIHQPGVQEMEKALSTMIVSASGWRKVFALGGDENDLSAQIAPVDKVICFLMAEAFSRFLKLSGSHERLKIALGMDSRRTGPLMAHLMLRVFLSHGIDVDYFDVVAGPEIMAHVKVTGQYTGFAYISASHNPPGHNGLKFGLGTGGVIGGSESKSLIDIFRGLCETPAVWPEINLKASEVGEELLKSVYLGREENLRLSHLSYEKLNLEIFTMETDPQAQKTFLDSIKGLLSGAPVGILGELNGSARGNSIDKSFLEGLGVKVRLVNSKPGEFVHTIVPEGASLDLCRQELDKARRTSKSFILGYVPDCDGDRGNLVYWSAKTGRTEILQAQEVFALCILSELAGMIYGSQMVYDEEGYPERRTAIVCNDPTSLRIDRIAEAFNVHVFRAEVGEANQVSMARTLRTQNWVVRILGEGSNGGNITHPGAVRDPLSTLGSVIKLLALRSTPGKPGLFEIWCRRSQQTSLYRADFTLQDVIDSLPPFITTSAFHERALLQIRSRNQGLLKAAYEKVLISTGWKENAEFLRNVLGIYGWEEINYEGTEEKRGFGPPFRTGKETGGLKILLKDQSGKAIGFVWMRGSGTEPVFRVMADIEGTDPFKEEWLLNWHVGMILKAD